MHKHQFHGELVLVTGSSRGIGKSIAYAFAKEGATVILNGASNKDALFSTYQDFCTEGFPCHYFLGDMSDYDTCKKMFESILERYHRSPSIIINNAGISHMGLLSDTPPHIWQQIINTNLNSAYHCSYLGTPSMIQSQKGCIINISSIWGICGASYEIAYSTSKSALNGFTKALGKELGPSNVRVNAIACGWIDTDMTAHFTEEDKEAFISEIPLSRIGNPTEIAQTCLYLASDAASYMTGQIITLDGGML